MDQYGQAPWIESDAVRDGPLKARCAVDGWLTDGVPLSAIDGRCRRNHFTFNERDLSVSAGRAMVDVHLEFAKCVY